MTTSALASGAVFAGDYRIVRPLSAGGMGAVYVAEQKSTGKLRALKLMHPQLAASEDLRRRFEQEARIGARIESEHVVEVQAAGVEPSTNAPYLVMELLDGEDLARVVARRGAFLPAEVAAVFEQLGHAMRAAHAAGIVHRDLKPENVFLSRARRAGAAFTLKVLDFGIAKLVEEGGGLSTAAIGSPMWLAPEQTERVPVTPAADVWALGLLAYYLLTGQSFWRAANDPQPSVAQLLREILVDPLDAATVRANAAGKELPPGFDGWFERCVVREPSARFHDAGEAVTALLALLPSGATVTSSLVMFAAPGAMVAPDPYAATEASGKLDGSAPPVLAPSPAPRSRSPLVAAGLVGLVLVIAGGAVVLRQRAHASGGEPSASASAKVAEPPSVTLADPIGDPPLLSLSPSSSAAPRSTAVGQAIGANPAQTALTSKTKGDCDCPPGDPLCTCAETKGTAIPVPAAEPKESMLGPAEKVFKYGNDPAQARQLLEARIDSGKASPREVALYRTICRQLHDAACTAHVNALYPATGATQVPPRPN